MGDHVNKWPLNIALGIITIFVAVAAYQGLSAAVGDFSSLVKG